MECNNLIFSKHKNFFCSMNETTGDIDIRNKEGALVSSIQRNGCMLEEMVTKAITEMEKLDTLVLNEQLANNPKNLIEEIIEDYKTKPDPLNEQRVKTILFLLKKMEYTAKKLFKAKEWMEKITDETGISLSKNENPLEPKKEA